ncbi:MAG: folylpolyglutamate synthase/dihydrofolate synthase family protein [Candidatus Caldatribacteriota bacterium]|nr:folylpolyglutamate synthase/dihydrofolate synthase family protein [Candidatus Caldatribacteriota bacterium]
MITYTEALDYIYDLTKYGIKLGLKNISYLLYLLGEPHKKIKIIHVAGTNGKGSTCSLISSILQSDGYKVGLYTSPHLVDFTERIKINQKPISREKVCKLLERIKPYIEKTANTPSYGHPTFFEVITSMAFLYFFEEQVDFLVLEVGLGGRLDATNVCEPLISIITHIDYDHMDKLGNSLEEIAREKGGIIKPEGIVISSNQYEEAYNELKKIADEKNSLIYSVGREINYKIVKSDIKGVIFNLKGIYNEYKNLHTPLLGRHQADNAATAITTVEALKIKGINISQKAIRDGLEKVKWTGRLEIIQNNPTLVLDGAHNPSGVKVARDALKEIFTYHRLILVLAIFADKDYKKMIQILAPNADLIITTRAKSPRAAPPQLIAKEAAQYIDKNKIIITENIPQAINCALSNSKEDDLICITGSLYNVGEAKRYFKNKIKLKI